MHLFLCQTDFESALADELRAEFAPHDSNQVVLPCPGVVELRTSDPLPERPVVGWAKQALPDAEWIVAPSIKAWAEAARYATDRRFVRVRRSVASADFDLVRSGRRFAATDRVYRRGVVGVSEAEAKATSENARR
ncbi:MAG: hypothetical protein QM811_28630 [Pirellulales bacterium]